MALRPTWIRTLRPGRACAYSGMSLRLRSENRWRRPWTQSLSRLAEALTLANARIEDITAAASITLKADEPSLLALAQQHGWSLTFYTPEQLADIPVPNPSETVRRFTGTPSVSEAAALLAAGMQSTLIVEKHKLRGVDGKNATISIASIASTALITS